MVTRAVPAAPATVPAAPAIFLVRGMVPAAPATLLIRGMRRENKKGLNEYA